jgi:cardiolipin synthase
MKLPWAARDDGRPSALRDPRLWAGPAAIGAAGLAWYASDSLRHRREEAFGYELIEGLDVGSPDYRRAAEALTGFPISEGSEAEPLINGDRIFPALLETIRGAERTLCLETYVYWTGEIAEEVAAAVCERAEAGVQCKVLVDAVGALKMETDLLKRMGSAGATVVKFRPPRPYAMRRLTNRTHRRLLIADGRAGMTGGVGIAREWEGDAKGPDEWRDTHLLVRGPVVRGLTGAFAEHWLEATGEVLAGEGFLPDLDPIPGGVPIQAVRSNAGIGDTNAEAIYYLAIASARRRLDLAAAYFVPRPAFIQALCEAADRGVEVRVVVPGSYIDKSLVRTAGRAAYDELLDGGVQVFEYLPTMFHAKTLAVDGQWATVGTVNFDNRSFQLHDEITLGVWSEDFATLLGESFDADVASSEEIEPHRWEQRTTRQRLTEGVTKFARREL